MAAGIPWLKRSRRISTSGGAARPPPSTPITPRYSGSRRPRCSKRSSPSSPAACSAPTACASSETNSPTRRHQTWEEHKTELEHLEEELSGINRSLRAQTLRLEEPEDFTHPVVALATERIDELSTRKSAVADAIQTLKAKRPAGHDPDEVASMLDAIPDMREALTTASQAQLAEIFRAFDVTITYDKANERLNLAATITPELLPDPADGNDRPNGAVADVWNSGGGIRTRDLRVMSPTSYQTAPPRGGPYVLAKNRTRDRPPTRRRQTSASTAPGPGHDGCVRQGDLIASARCA